MFINKKIAAGVFALIAIGLFVALISPNLISDPFGNSGTTYQAVFLANGQVYFGKLSNADGLWLTLEDIYYLQTTPSPSEIQSNQQPSSNINLVKLGGELHGPTDKMRVNRTSVLFVEDLRSDSGVVLAIDKLKKSK
jgi:hypothetical protein